MQTGVCVSTERSPATSIVPQSSLATDVCPPTMKKHPTNRVKKELLAAFVTTLLHLARGCQPSLTPVDSLSYHTKEDPAMHVEAFACIAVFGHWKRPKVSENVTSASGLRLNSQTCNKKEAN